MHQKKMYEYNKFYIKNLEIILQTKEKGVLIKKSLQKRESVAQKYSIKNKNK